MAQISSLVDFCIATIINKKINFTYKSLPYEVVERICTNFNKPYDLISDKVKLYGLYNYDIKFTGDIYSLEPNNKYLLYLTEQNKYAFGKVFWDNCEETRTNPIRWLLSDDFCIYYGPTWSCAYSIRNKAYLIFDEYCLIRRENINHIPEYGDLKYPFYMNLEDFPKAIPRFRDEDIKVAPGCAFINRRACIAFIQGPYYVHRCNIKFHNKK